MREEGRACVQPAHTPADEQAGKDAAWTSLDVKADKTDGPGDCVQYGFHTSTHCHHFQKGAWHCDVSRLEAGKRRVGFCTAWNRMRFHLWQETLPTRL